MQIRRVWRAAVVVGSVLMLAGILGPTLIGQQRNVSLKGVWRCTEWSTNGPIPGAYESAHTNKSPQPWWGIFTDHHHAWIGVAGDAPRPVPRAGEVPTDKQIAEAANLFIGFKGTYEVVGGELRTKIDVGLPPGSMRQGAFQNFSFKFDGKDAFWITLKEANDLGPLTNTYTWRFVRVE